MNYTQCQLNKKDRFDIAWIPSKFALIGKFIKIKIDDIWDNGWKVVNTYSSNTENHILEHEMEYRKQRRASDIQQKSVLIPRYDLGSFQQWFGADFVKPIEFDRFAFYIG